MCMCSVSTSRSSLTWRHARPGGRITPFSANDFHFPGRSKMGLRGVPLMELKGCLHAQMETCRQRLLSKISISYDFKEILFIH